MSWLSGMGVSLLCGRPQCVTAVLFYGFLLLDLLNCCFYLKQYFHFLLNVSLCSGNKTTRLG